MGAHIAHRSGLELQACDVEAKNYRLARVTLQAVIIRPSDSTIFLTYRHTNSMCIRNSRATTLVHCSIVLCRSAGVIFDTNSNSIQIPSCGKVIFGLQGLAPIVRCHFRHQHRFDSTFHIPLGERVVLICRGWLQLCGSWGRRQTRGTCRLPLAFSCGPSMQVSNPALPCCAPP